MQLIKNFKIQQSFKIETHLIIFIYVLLFFISASPITHADSLDYHFLGALNLINNGHFQKEILPMHTILASVGEIPLALGLVNWSRTIWRNCSIFIIAFFDTNFF